MNRHDTLLLSCGTPEDRKTLRSILGETYNLLEASNMRQTLLLMEQNRGCIAALILVVTDPALVEMDILRRKETTDFFSWIPVIVVTEDDQPCALDEAFSWGAADVIPLQYDPYAMLHRIENIVQLHLHKQNLEELVKEQAQLLRHSNDTMVDALSSIIEYRSVESGQHILRIRQYTKVLLEQVALSCPEYALTEEIISIISSAAALHDVGKIGIPDSILIKPGPLTPEERETMKTHTLIGCQILESLSDMGNEEYLRYAHNICHYHHERWDGGGYPEGLAGEDIPICAQVVGLADVYDALTSKRVYKDPYDLTSAVNMIFNGEAGTFSPKLLECFKRVIPRFEEVSRAYADGVSPKSETFDVRLPEPSPSDLESSLHIIQGKYQCLLHYINAFVLELSVDRGYYHLRYNPYPELGIVGTASNFRELEQIILEQIVAPEDRQRMYDLIHTGIEDYLQAGMRRQNFRFSLKRSEGVYQPYSLTLLRANVNQKGARSLAVLCRKLDSPDASTDTPESPTTLSSEMVGSAFCCRNDRDFTLIRCTSGDQQIAGYSWQAIREQFGGKLIRMICPEDREEVRSSLREQLNRGTNVQMEFRVLRQDGLPVWVMYEGRLALEPDGQECLHSYMTDISATRHAYNVLNEKMDRYEIILAQTENALFDWNMETDTITFSDTWKSIFGLSPISRNVRQALTDASFLHPDDLPLLLDRIRNLENGSSYEMLEVRISTNRGRYLWFRIRASALRDDVGKLNRIVGLIVNIDAEKQAEQALQDRADRDALTKLLNKDAGRRQAEEYLSQFPRGVNCALLIIDLDNFKQVNDQYGHLFGDSVLIKAAKEIRKLFRAQDIVARIGGDEFMVLLRGVSDKTLVENRCIRLLTTFRSVFRDNQYKLPISCSIGIALSPTHGSSFVELFQRADQALYCAKARGRNTHVIYNAQDAFFRSRAVRSTAVSNHIDSDNQPGMADDNIVQYAFRRLYSSGDMDASIGEILDLIGRQMNVSRVYVFENTPDNRYCSNTYEWCNTGIAPQIHNLQLVSYETDIPDYDKNFDENGIFYCPDISTLPPNLYDILAPQGIKSILHCAMRENNVFRGYVGFDECHTQRLWTKEQIQLLTYFSEMLSVFLMKHRSQLQAEQQARELNQIMDDQNGWVYIVDPETHRLNYANAQLRSSRPEAIRGNLCYCAIAGRDTPCPGCPMASLAGQRRASFVLPAPKMEGYALTEVSRIRWEGKDLCMVSSRMLPEGIGKI